MRSLIKKSYGYRRPLESGLFLILMVLAVSLILRLANLFSPLISTASIIGCVFILASIRSSHHPGTGRLIKFLCLAGLMLSATICLQPSETLSGNWDPGIYLAQGMAAAKTTGWTLPDTASEAVPEEARRFIYPRDRGIDVKVPGFYASKHEPGALVPQFFPLYPTLLALAARAGGLNLALRVDLLCIFLGFFLLSHLASNITGKRVAGLLVLIFAVAHPAVLWFARFHTSESLLFLLFAIFSWSTALCALRGEWSHALIATGASLLIPWVTPVAVPWILFLPGLFIMRPIAIAQRMCIVVAGLISAIGVWIFLDITNHPYGESIKKMIPEAKHWAHAMNGSVGVGEVVTIAAGLAVVSAVYLVVRKRLARNTVMVCGAFVVLIVANVFTYWATPLLPPFARGILTLVPLPLACMAIAGVILLGARYPALRAWTCWTGLFAIITTLIFLKWPMVPAQFPWAWKRWIWFLLPCAVLFATIATYALPTAARRGRTGVLLIGLAVAGITALPFHYHRGLLSADEWRGYQVWLAGLSESIPDRAIVIAPKELATPLEFIYDHTVIPLYSKDNTPRERAYKDLWNQASVDKPVYVIADAPPKWLPVEHMDAIKPEPYMGHWIRQKRSALYFHRQPRSFKPMIWVNDPKE